MLCFREFLRSRAVRRLDDLVTCIDQAKLKCLFCFGPVHERMGLIWVDKLLLNYDQ